MSKTIVWQRMILKGFACYRRGIEVTFNQGLNHLVAANEQGKSTLLVGLAAVLFGLPNISDPSKYGKAKYRSWVAAEYFQGEVEFKVGENTYRVQRDFITNRISLAQRQEGRWRELVGGEHCPGARRRNIKYEQMLVDLLGIVSDATFWSTFCVGQPLPEPGQINQNIQQLLSGSGSHGGQALKKLEEWLGEKTKYTGRLGVTSRDKNLDRELEELLQEKQRLEEMVQETAANVDSVHILQQQMAMLEEQKRKIGESLQQKEELHQGWVRWRSLRERYVSVLQEQSRLRRAKERALYWEKEIKKSDTEIKNQYPEFLRPLPDLETNLETLIQLEKDIQQQREAAKTLKANLQVQKEKIYRLQNELAGSLTTVKGRPQLATEHQELLQLLQQRQQLEKRLTDLRQQQKETERILKETGRWAGLGEQPLAFYKQTAQIAAQKYEELGAMLEEQKAKHKKMATRYEFLQRGTPELLADCQNYHARKGALEQNYEQAMTVCRQARERFDHYQEKKESIERQYADLADIPATAIDALETKFNLERKKQLAEKEIANTSFIGSIGKGYGTVLLLAMIGAGAALAAGQGLISLILTGMAVALGGGAYISFRRTTAPRKQELEQIEKELAALVAQLGAWAQCPLDELAAIRERLITREQQYQELALLAKDLPADGELNRLEEAAFQAGEQLKDFNRRLQPLIAVLGDPQSAYYAWQSSKRDLSQLEQRLNDFARKEYGVLPSMVNNLELEKAKGGQEIRILAAIVGQDLKTISAAACWLTALPAECWETWRKETNDYQKAKTSLLACKLRHEELDPLDADGQSLSQRLDKRIDELRRSITPFTEETPTEELKQLLAKCSQGERALELAQGLFNEQQQRLSIEEGKIKGLLEEQENLTVKLADILTPAAGQALTAKERWQCWQQKEAEKQQLKDNLQGLLKGLDVVSLEELELKLTDVENSALQIRTEWQQLVETNPGLPGLEMKNDREQLEAEYAALKRERAALQVQARDLEEQIFKSNKKLSSLSGQEVVNIPAAKERITVLKIKHERLQLETEALVVAYKELTQVRNLYNATHRQRLAAAVNQYFADFTGVPERQIILDDEFQIKISESSGQTVEIAQLSQGTQDQLQIALRLAIADLVAGDYHWPLLFDDPFLNFDTCRLQQLQTVLDNLAEQRQILILSHRQEYERWGSPVKIRNL